MRSSDSFTQILVHIPIIATENTSKMAVSEVEGINESHGVGANPGEKNQDAIADDIHLLRRYVSVLRRSKMRYVMDK